MGLILITQLIPVILRHWAGLRSRAWSRQADALLDRKKASSDICLGDLWIGSGLPTRAAALPR